MKNGHAILIDSSAIIGASCPQEAQHEYCKPLFDFFKENPIGIVTPAIKESVKRNTSRKYGLVNLEKLDSNLSLLKTEEPDYIEVAKLLPRIQKFYENLPSLVDRYIHISKKAASEKMRFYLRGTSRRFINGPVKEAFRKQVHGEYPADYAGVESVLLEKMHKYPPSVDDVLLLGEGQALKKEHENISIASIDHHLSPIRLGNGIKESFIPDLIEKEFGLVCDWPNALIGKL